MKKISISVLFLSVFGPLAWAANIALVYENESAVKAGQATMGAVTTEGVVVSAKWALANNATLLVGIPGDVLKKAILLKLDTKSDAALIQPGKEVSDPTLQEAYQEKAQSFLAFLPASVAPAAAPTVVSSQPAASEISTAAYKVLINGREAGTDPIPLLVRFRKSELNFEFVRISSSPVWYFDVEITGTPKLSFWKKGKNQSLMDVPVPDFTYKQQIFFKPLTSGRSIKLGVEAYFMNEGPYTLNFVLTSKDERTSVKVPVIFKTKL